MTLTALRALTWTMVTGTVSCAFLLSTAQMEPARQAERPSRLAAAPRPAELSPATPRLMLVRALLTRRPVPQR